MNRLVVLLLTLCSGLSFAQTPVTTYYDRDKTTVKEKYEILNNDSSQVHGEYTRYHPDGSVAAKGTFDKGVKTGNFYEYHPNGQVAQELHFEAGVRNGAVMVYDRNGTVIQTGLFRNDALTGELSAFYSGSGAIKSVTQFKGGKPEGLVKEYFENAPTTVQGQ